MGARYARRQRNLERDGELPLGVARAVDLALRGFEIRDSGGVAVVSGALPGLVHEGPFFFLFMESIGHNLVTIPAPGPPGGYTLWIADDDGEMSRVGDLLQYPAWRQGRGDGWFKGWDGNDAPPREIPTNNGASIPGTTDPAR